MRYKVGDIVYIPSNGNKEVRVLCPVCYGKMKVTITLGNGDTVIVPCNYCGNGYEGPRGYVLEYEYVCEGALFIITAAEVKITSGGEEVEYHSGTCNSYRVMKEQDCYGTVEEAAQAAIAIKAELELVNQKRSDWAKKDKNKSYSWNAGYHMREAKRLRKDIEYHERMAIVCKESAK